MEAHQAASLNVLNSVVINDKEGRWDQFLDAKPLKWPEIMRLLTNIDIH